MSIDTSVNEFLNRSGAPVAKFDTIGKLIRGVIESADVTDQTDIKTGEVKRWNDGSARKQLVIVLLTEDRDPTVPDDDGHRRLFAKSNMLNVIREAVKAAGGKLEVGGKLAVQYVSDGEASAPGMSPPKIYKAQYQAPERSAISSDDLL